MKRITALLLCLLLAGLSACSLTEATEEEEPFSADFTIRENPEPTEVFMDSVYSGETKVYSSDSINIADLRALLSETVFGSKKTVSLWKKEIYYAFDGTFNAENIEVVNEIAGDFDQCTAFPGMCEMLPNSADLLIRFADEPSDLTYTTDAYGYITGGTITIPADLPAAQQKALLYASLFHVCGFFGKAETALDSILSENPTNVPQEIDWILLDFLYSGADAGMTESECLNALDAFIMN